MWPASDRLRAPVGDFPPRWATSWGDDAFGLWAELVAGPTTQRLRWIEPTGPAGFWMGSSQAERGAIDDERVRDWANGSEHAPRRVVLSEGFWLADTLCTQAFWAAVMAGDLPSHFVKASDAPGRPVEQVSWDDVQRFLIDLERLCPPLAGRCDLPSEAQWEYVARAGSRSAYTWGDAADDSRANWNNRHNGTTPVAQFPANGFGLYDMHGNVWEWCADLWRERLDQQAAFDGSSQPRRVVRGGSWFSSPGEARSAHRLGWLSGSRTLSLGFRLALRSSNTVQAR